jgi:hypothetical protein
MPPDAGARANRPREARTVWGEVLAGIGIHPVYLVNLGAIVAMI